jgi:hypothetical protein
LTFPERAALLRDFVSGEDALNDASISTYLENASTEALIAQVGAAHVAESVSKFAADSSAGLLAGLRSVLDTMSSEVSSRYTIEPQLT